MSFKGDRNSEIEERSHLMNCERDRTMKLSSFKISLTEVGVKLAFQPVRLAPLQAELASRSMQLGDSLAKLVSLGTKPAYLPVQFTSHRTKPASQQMRLASLRSKSVPKVVPTLWA